MCVRVCVCHSLHLPLLLPRLHQLHTERLSITSELVFQKIFDEKFEIHVYLGAPRVSLRPRLNPPEFTLTLIRKDFR